MQKNTQTAMQNILHCFIIVSGGEILDCQNKMNEIIDYLENRMCEEIDLEKAARHAGYSLWEFQRIFSFLTNTTAGAYIRKRKLSLERFTSMWVHNNLFGSENNPLLGKKVGIFTYCSCFICQCDDIAGIFRKFVVLDEYDETKNAYKYLTTEYLYSEHYAKNYTKKGPDNIFNHDIVEYVKSVALWLS